MNLPSSFRKVNLIDARMVDRPFVVAVLYRDYSPNYLEFVEESWARARQDAASAGAAAGLAPLEHAHWDWRHKAKSVESRKHMLVAIDFEDEIQGIMAVLRTPRLAQLGDGQVVYVDYVESAPWNLKGSATLPCFYGVGTVLIAEAVRLSLETGLGGRVGLHSLPQAEAFYSRCGMTNVGTDPYYFDLTYFEFTQHQATEWLSSIGESP